MVHLALFVRKLTGAEAGILVYHNRRLDFLVAVSSIDVEEEVDQCALEFRSLSLIYRESGSGYLHSEVEVYDVIFLCKFPVRECVLRKLHFRASHLDNLVVFSALARFHQVARHIRQKHQLILKFLLCRRHLGENGT